MKGKQQLNVKRPLRYLLLLLLLVLPLLLLMT